LAPVAPDYDPEPDVAIVSADEDGDIRYSDRFFLTAEIVSRSDERTVESKREVYQRHPDCRCVLVIQQDRFDVRVAVLTDAGWADRRLTNATAELALEEFCLRCTLADLYRGTRLQPRRR
jgi:Uma2 family endonuclease